MEKYYTANNFDITFRIKLGLTDFFLGANLKAQQKSESYARKNRTYCYPVYDKRGKSIGFAVPK